MQSYQKRPIVLGQVFVKINSVHMYQTRVISIDYLCYDPSKLMIDFVSKLEVNLAPNGRRADQQAGDPGFRSCYNDRFMAVLNKGLVQTAQDLLSATHGIAANRSEGVSNVQYAQLHGVTPT
jgi:hypothetical protein